MRYFIKIFVLIAILFTSSQFVMGEEPIRVIVIGAHPDDCDILAGGIAALYSQMGHKVKFVSLTNGNKGHHLMKPDELAARRKREMKEAGRILNIEYDNLDNNDGELAPSLENRKAVIKLICDWEADIVITHRPNDYHPDHRYTSVIVQDAAYMISVPLMYPNGKPLAKTPVFLYLPDPFQKPNPFSPDIVVDITSVARKKAEAMCAHESQLFEWLPWIEKWEDKLPSGDAEKREFVSNFFLSEYSGIDKFLKPALNWYTFDQLRNAHYVEAFEICEYSYIPNKEEIKKLFPMLPK